MQNKIFWNIERNSIIDDNTMIEHTIKYGDFKDIVDIFKKYNKTKIKNIWLKTMAQDSRFLKINLMIARVFFNMDIESNYFKGLKSERFKVRVSVK